MINIRKLKYRIKECKPLIDQDTPFILSVFGLTEVNAMTDRLLHEVSPTLRKNLEEWVNRKPLSAISIDGYTVESVMKDHWKTSPYWNDGELFMEAILILSDYEKSGRSKETRCFPFETSGYIIPDIPGLK